MCMLVLKRNLGKYTRAVCRILLIWHFAAALLLPFQMLVLTDRRSRIMCQNGGKWFGMVHKAWLAVFSVWLPQSITDKVKYFLSFIFLVSNYRNTYYYNQKLLNIIKQEDLQIIFHATKTVLEIVIEVHSHGRDSSHGNGETLQLRYKQLSFCVEMIHESRMTGF